MKQKFVSRLGDSEVIVDAVNKHSRRVTVTRRVIDRKTGEVNMEERERTVPNAIWKNFVSAYEPSTT